MTLEMIKANWKRYLFSSVITFIAGFMLAVLPELDSLTLEGVKGGALIGVFFAGLRAGVKVLFESFLVAVGKR